MKILISGCPGTGKSFVGDNMAANHGFTHVDLEEESYEKDLFCKGDFPTLAAKIPGKLICTLGYDPVDIGAIASLQPHGFILIWFDAPVVFCRTHWKPKVGQDPITFDIQICKIVQRYRDLRELYSGREINVATSDLKHRPVCSLIKEILEIATQG